AAVLKLGAGHSTEHFREGMEHNDGKHRHCAQAINIRAILWWITVRHEPDLYLLVEAAPSLARE
ncbi:hypothetical protein, partial [Pseudomonas aeruginosa]|uniref:hypothetical protein n=3 Tax=Pseudomonas aeruginosa TaxID=287 RepID=UPI001ABCD468